MLTRRVLFSGLMLAALASSTAQAVEPVIRLSDTCTMPTMPGRGASKLDWDTYAVLVKDYNECLATKARKYGDKTKEALEGVGNTVTGWSDTATGWFKK